jgi:transmembrane sensor
MLKDPNFSHYMEHTWFLMSRTLSGEATEAEKAELMQLLQQDAALQQQFDILKTWWQSQTASTDVVEPDKISQILNRSLTEMPDRSGRILHIFRRISARAAVIAGLLICITAVGIWFVMNGKQPAEVQQIVAGNGSRTRTILPDGSTVWLNAGSSLSYTQGLPGEKREVTLEGEAYFDIVKRAGRPFIVHTKEINVHVLGTAFNVKSYPGDKIVETTLIRGLVSITRNTNAKEGPVYLKPHQKFVLSVDQNKELKLPSSNNSNPPKPSRIKELFVMNIDSSIDVSRQLETAWVYNRLEFRGDTFEELAKKLERWYNIHVRFEDEQVKQLTFNGSLENETVEQAFNALQSAVPFKFSINENEISVRSL